MVLVGAFLMPSFWTRRNGGHERGTAQHAPRHLSKDDSAKERKEAKVLSALALASVLYTVKPGDTLSGIAQHYNTTWEAIYDDNHSAIRNPNLVYAGQRLRVHEGDLTRDMVPVRSYNVTPAPASPPAQSTSDSASSDVPGYDSGALDDIPGVPQSFAACVAYRESTDDTNPAADGNAYGIIGASGYNVSGDSIAQQKQVFKQIYDTTGPSAWAADGC
jgi:LysM repeat protein